MNEKKWQPNINIQNLLKRSALLKKVRVFFENHGYLEVETPYITMNTTTDPYLVPFRTNFSYDEGVNNSSLYLITSPEFHMKRLIAAIKLPIFQISHSFRDQEKGNLHNPEFTLLEWYRPNFSMKDLISEVEKFLRYMLSTFEPTEKVTYQDVFKKHLNIDPLTEKKENIYGLCKKRLGLDNAIVNMKQSINELLEILFTFLIMPKIGEKSPIIVYHFPASMAQLAAINSQNSQVAERFEVYYKGIELANGCKELTCKKEQKKRFLKDIKIRMSRNLPYHPMDTRLLDALENGLPDFSGVAVGLDRLIMIALNAKHIKEIMTFSIERA